MDSKTKRERIVALDLLRGYFLIVILIDHLGFFPSPFEFLTGRGNLWASAAEGFFLISGLLVGYVYTPRMVRSFRDGAIKIWKRARLLYIWSVVLTVIFTVWGQFVTPAYVSGGLWQSPPIGEFLYKTLTLQYSYGWADFLQYYAVFMVVAPIALWMCLKGYAWAVIVLSVATWLFAGGGYYLSWQLLFAIGIVVGYYLPSIQRWFKSQPRLRQRRVYLSILSAAFVVVLISVLINRLGVYLVATYPGFATLPQWIQISALLLQDIRTTLVPWTAKEDLGLLRLITALLWFTALYLLFRRFEGLIERITRGTLRSIGENSLLVYIFQSFLVFAALAYLGQEHSVMVSTMLTTVAILLTYFAVVYKSVPSMIAGKLVRLIRR